MTSRARAGTAGVPRALDDAGAPRVVGSSRLAGDVRASRVAGVLLAAGGARRFGAPKQLAELEGRPLVLHALECLLAVDGLDDIVVVVGAHRDAVAAAVERVGSPRIRIVSCPGWAEGLSASLRAGVTAVGGADAVLLHLADLPRVTAEAMALVLAAASEAGTLRAEPTRATYGGVPGHPVVLPATLFRAVTALRGDTGARDLLADPATRRVEVGHLSDPTDVDTPQTLESLTA